MKERPDGSSNVRWQSLLTRMRASFRTPRVGPPARRDSESESGGGLSDAQPRGAGAAARPRRRARLQDGAAAAWYAKAAAQGHADAQFNLGFAYESGKIIAQRL